MTAFKLLSNSAAIGLPIVVIPVLSLDLDAEYTLRAKIDCDSDRRWHYSGRL